MNVQPIPYQQPFPPVSNDWQAHSLPNDLYPGVGGQPAAQQYYTEQGTSPSLYMPPSTEPPFSANAPPSRPISISTHPSEAWKTSSRMSVNSEAWKMSSRAPSVVFPHASPTFDQRPQSYTPQQMEFSSPIHAHWQASQALDLATPVMYPPMKALPQEPPAAPPRASMPPGGFVIPPQQPSPMIQAIQQPHNAAHWDYSSSIMPTSLGGYPYDNVAYTDSGFQEPIPLTQPMHQQPLPEQQHMEYVPPLQLAEQPPASPQFEVQPDIKKKTNPECKQRQITVQSINKEHRVWIDILPNETGASLARKIHIIATFQTRKVLSITTKSGKSIQLNHRPVFVNWKDMDDFEDGEEWKVELGERDRGVMDKVDKVFSKMVQASGGRRNK